MAPAGAGSGTLAEAAKAAHRGSAGLVGDRRKGRPEGAIW
jgi:hypothetical protein